jgi:hypothetical protein
VVLYRLHGAAVFPCVAMRRRVPVAVDSNQLNGAHFTAT